MYQIEIENRCLKELKRLDKKILKKAFHIIDTVIALNPFIGKQLTGKYSGLFSHRFSNYRIIYEIMKNKVTVLILRIGHRKNVYDGL